MIRFLGLFVVFVFGLAGAMLWYGQMHQLRQAVPDGLPAWMADISGTSSLGQGRMVRGSDGIVPELTLRWSVRTLTSEGLVWDLAVTGAGLALKADVLVPYWPDRIFIRNGSGTIALADFYGPRAGGALMVTEFDGEVRRLSGTPSPRGRLSATANDITLDDIRLGSGPITATMDFAGSWQAGVALTGGASDMTGQVRGEFLSSNTMLDVTIADASALPESTRQALAMFGKMQGNALRLTIPIGAAAANN